MLLALRAHRVLSDVGGHTGGNLQLVLGLLAGHLQVGAALVQRLTVLTPRHWGQGGAGYSQQIEDAPAYLGTKMDQVSRGRFTLVPFYK